MGQVIINNARFSYAYIFQPQKPGRDGKPGKYQVDILWPKTDQATTNAVGQALQQVYAEAQQDQKFADVMVRGTFKWDVIKDGYKAKFGKADFDLYKDCYFVVAKSKEPVQVIDQNGLQLLTDREFFSGCYGNAGVAFKTYAPTKNVPESGYGISCSLLALMKTGGTEADRLAGNVTVQANQFFNVQAASQMPGFPAPGMPQPAPQFQPQPTQQNAYPAQNQQFAAPQPQPAAPGYGQPQQFAAPGAGAAPAMPQPAPAFGAPAQPQFGAPAPAFGTGQAPANFGAAPAPTANPFQQVAQPAQSPGMPAPQQFAQPQAQPGQHQPTPAWPGAQPAPQPQGFDPFQQQAQQPASPGQPQQ